MPIDPKITRAVYGAIDELNKQRPRGKLKKDKDTVLYDKSSDLDSLDLVNLVVAVEQRIEESFGVSLTLANDKALSQKKSPFRTVASLESFVAGLLKEAGSRR